jgi:hypothetical protein
MQSDTKIKKDDRVLVDEKVILAKLARDASPLERKTALSDKYFITGVGPTCYGIRNSNSTLRFNTLHGTVIAIV